MELVGRPPRRPPFGQMVSPAFCLGRRCGNGLPRGGPAGYSSDKVVAFLIGGVLRKAAGSQELFQPQCGMLTAVCIQGLRVTVVPRM